MRVRRRRNSHGEDFWRKIGKATERAESNDEAYINEVT
jgi:hypothetical protein